MLKFYKYFVQTALVAAVILTQPLSSMAQENPPLPEPLQNLVKEGAQMRYLGFKNGLDGWIAIKGGQEQYFYVTPDGQGFVMGLLFDKNGKIVTLRQVKELQEQGGGAVLDLFASDKFTPEQQSEPNQPGNAVKKEFKTPSEQLFDDVENSNWVSLGDPAAPYIYTFVDPQCPHCHAFINDVRRDYIENGILQVRMIPVGFREETMAQAAFLLAVPNPQRRWYSHLDGDDAALPVTADINQQGVQRNLAIMQSWKVNVTPFTVYRAGGGEVKIVQGRAQDIEQMISDLR